MEFEISKIIGKEDGTYTGVGINLYVGPDEYFRRGDAYISKRELYFGVASMLSRHFNVRLYTTRPFFKKHITLYWDERGNGLKCINREIVFGGPDVYDDYNLVIPIIVNHIKGLCGML